MTSSDQPHVTMLQKYDYEDSIIYWIFTTSHLLQRVLSEEFAPLGVTYRQAEVLGWLSLEGENLSQAALARRMQVAAPTLGGIVDRMERDGWIVRQPSPEDRRKILLRPTKQVEPIWEQMLEIGLKVRDRAMKGFSPEQVQTILSCLATIQDNLNTEEPEAGNTL